MSSTRPDILLIILDTQRRDRLSIYGHSCETSPHLDAFAQSAVLFELALSPAQWTIPAHASIFTGLYPGVHRMIQGNSRLSGVHPTLAEILQADGYHTAAFCNNPLVGVLDNGLQRGFMDFFNYAGAAPNRPRSTPDRGLRRALASRWERFARRVSNRFAHSDRLFRMSMHPFVVPLWTRWANYKGSAARSIGDLIAYLKRRRAGGRDAPLFAFLNLMETHLPYHPPRESLRRVAPEISRDRAALRFMQRFNANASRWAAPAVPAFSVQENHVIRSFYDAEIAHQDEQLGRLLGSGLLDDMLVVIAADHGEGHGDHGFFGHSFVVYQELAHVPLAIRWPGRFPAGARVQTAVSTRRIFHTVLEAAGVAPPLDQADPNADVAGLSLARVADGQPDADGDAVFTEAYPPQTIVNFISRRSPELIAGLRLSETRRGVIQGRHKLVMAGSEVEGLFDLAADPAEQYDISGKHPDESAALRRRLAAFVQAGGQSRSDNGAFVSFSDEVAQHLRALGYIE